MSDEEKRSTVVEYKGYTWEACWRIVGDGWSHQPCDGFGGCAWVDAWFFRQDDDEKPVLLELFIGTDKPPLFKDEVRPKVGELVRDKDGNMMFGADAFVNISNVRDIIEKAVDLFIAGQFTQL